MNFGLNVFDANGVQTLGMEDFTIQKLAQMVLPATRAGGQGVNSSYILMDVPGYDPATCFVTITPKVYGPPQSQIGQWGVLPTYKDLGGTKIGIITYVNYRKPTGFQGNYTDLWAANIVECVIEVVKVI
jgi:hypothetical protein